VCSWQNEGSVEGEALIRASDDETDDSNQAGDVRSLTQEMYGAGIDKMSPDMSPGMRSIVVGLIGTAFFVVLALELLG
jgi:hypothetical protein